MRLAELRVVTWDKQIMIGKRAEDHALIELERRIADRRERSIEKRDVASHVLLRIGAGERHEVLVEQIGSCDFTGSNRRCEARLDLGGDLDSLIDEFGIDRLEAGTRC